MQCTAVQTHTDRKFMQRKRIECARADQEGRLKNVGCESALNNAQDIRAEDNLYQQIEKETPRLEERCMFFTKWHHGTHAEGVFHSPCSCKQLAACAFDLLSGVWVHPGMCSAAGLKACLSWFSHAKRKGMQAQVRVQTDGGSWWKSQSPGRQ
eukprot:1155471-Pelagomonas_calceolata.AAC.4